MILARGPWAQNGPPPGSWLSSENPRRHALWLRHTHRYCTPPGPGRPESGVRYEEDEARRGYLAARVGRRPIPKLSICRMQRRAWQMADGRWQPSEAKAEAGYWPGRNTTATKRLREATRATRWKAGPGCLCIDRPPSPGLGRLPRPTSRTKLKHVSKDGGGWIRMAESV